MFLMLKFHRICL